MRFDLLIVGAGIHGAACAYEASRRGLRVLLVDRGDLAGGASSNSMRIAHGGLRSLQSLDLARSVESIRERRRLLERAPRWVRPLPCRLDLAGASALYRGAFRTGLALDALMVAALERGAPARARLPRLRAPRWSDALIEDTERVLLGLVHAAQATAPGRVEVRTYAPVERVEHAPECVRVAVGGIGQVEAGCLLDCRGATHAGQPVVLSMNVVVGGLSFGSGNEAVGLRHPEDARNVFVVPWRGCCIVGTHDRAYPFDPSAPLRVESAWVDEVLRWLAPVHPELASLRRSDVRRVHAGLLPAEPGRKAEPARRPTITEHGREVRVQGVKWTTAAAVAERAVERAARVLGRGGAQPGPGADLERGEALREAFLAADPSRREPLLAGSALRRGDVLFAVEREWARALDDVLLRRTGAASTGHPGRSLVTATADLLQRALDWTEAHKRAEIERFDSSFHFAGNVRSWPGQAAPGSADDRAV